MTKSGGTVWGRHPSMGRYRCWHSATDSARLCAYMCRDITRPAPALRNWRFCISERSLNDTTGIYEPKKKKKVFLSVEGSTFTCSVEKLTVSACCKNNFPFFCINVSNEAITHCVIRLLYCLPFRHALFETRFTGAFRWSFLTKYLIAGIWLQADCTLHYHVIFLTSFSLLYMFFLYSFSFDSG